PENIPLVLCASVFLQIAVRKPKDCYNNHTPRRFLFSALPPVSDLSFPDRKRYIHKPWNLMNGDHCISPQEFLGKPYPELPGLLISARKASVLRRRGLQNFCSSQYS